MPLAPILNTVTVPLLLLSGILLPMSLAPDWLNNLSRLNPLRYIVDGLRDAFLGHYTSPTLWVAFTVAAALAALTLTWGTLIFRRETA